MIVYLKWIEYIQTKKQKYMKKLFIIAMVLLLLAGCDYDPVLTNITTSLAQQGKNTHGLLGLIFIFGPMIIIIMMCIWPHKKKLKH